MDELEIGIYSSLVCYGLIVAWTLMFRLRWLPVALIRPVHWPLNRLERVPFLGRITKACRDYPLTLGVVLAGMVGVLVPYAVFASLWLLQTIAIGTALLFGALLAFMDNKGEDDSLTPNPNRLYWSVHRDEIVHGWDSRADASQPWF
jgi:hypothetical protein